MIIARPTMSDAATITAGSEAGTMPASNLLRVQPTDVWRATELDKANIVLDLGAANSVRMVWLGYTNATAAALWRVRAAATQAELTDGPGYDSGWLPHYPCASEELPPADLDGWGRTHAFLWLAAAETYRWWRIDVNDPANPAGFYQAGRLYLADPWQPEFNRRYGGTVSVAEDTSVQRARGGQTFASRGAMRRETSFTIPFRSEEDLYAQAERLDRVVGSRSDCLIVFDPQNLPRFMDCAFYARLTGQRPIIESAFRFWEKTYSAEEWEMP